MKTWLKEIGRFALIGAGSVVLGKVRVLIPDEFRGVYSAFVVFVVVLAVVFSIKYGFKKRITK